MAPDIEHNDQFEPKLKKQPGPNPPDHPFDSHASDIQNLARKIEEMEARFKALEDERKSLGKIIAKDHVRLRKMMQEFLEAAQAFTGLTGNEDYNDESEVEDNDLPASPASPKYPY